LQYKRRDKLFKRPSDWSSFCSESLTEVVKVSSNIRLVTIKEKPQLKKRNSIEKVLTEKIERYIGLDLEAL
jgi:hypothetical protein